MTTDYGFIHGMTEFILEHCPTNYGWAQANATALLSTAIGPEKRIRSPISPLRLNSMDMMIGPSGLAFKSAVLKGFTYPILVQLSDLIDIDVIMPNRYSIEGMIEWFANHSSHGAYIRDEFTTVFKETNKSYLGDTLEFISEMYDGTMQKRFTRRTKLEQTIGVYVPFLAATTPYLYKLMKPSFFVQGTGNRPRYIIFDVDEVNGDFEWNFSRTMELRKNKKLKEFADLLALYYKSPIRTLHLAPESEEIWKKYWKEVTRVAKERCKKDPFDLLYTYMIRGPERVLKYAGLRRLSYNVASIMNSPPDIPIMEEDIIWGLEEDKRSFNNFTKLLREWKEWGKKDVEVTGFKDKIWQMCTVLASAPNRMLNTHQWRDQQDIVGSNTFWEYKRKAKALGWVKRLKQEELRKVKELPNEAKRLELDRGPRIGVWTVTDKWLRGGM